MEAVGHIASSVRKMNEKVECPCSGSFLLLCHSGLKPRNNVSLTFKVSFPSSSNFIKINPQEQARDQSNLDNRDSWRLNSWVTSDSVKLTTNTVTEGLVTKVPKPGRVISQF